MKIVLILECLKIKQYSQRNTLKYWRCRLLPSQLKTPKDLWKKYYGKEQNSFMAIALPKADQDMFELDFHDLERKILYNKGCAKKVIKLLKYMRDVKGGPFCKLWSHLLKVILHHILNIMKGKAIISQLNSR